MPQLDWTTYPSQIFWLFLMFFLLWGLMSFVLLPPLEKILDQRRLYMKQLRADAEGFLEKAQSLQKQNALHLEEVRLECEKKLLMVMKEKTETLKKASEDANHEVQKKIQELAETIEQIKNKGLKDAAQMIPELKDTLLGILRSMPSQEKKN